VPELLKKKLQRQDQIIFHFISIDSLGWPEATLLRYQIYSDHIKNMKCDYLMHLDADMLFSSDFKFPILDNGSTDMLFVQHPGFANLAFNFSNPVQSLKNFWRRMVMGGYGSWETREKSQAFVPRKLRTTYYCGGIWFGKTKVFTHFINVCRKAVEVDIENNFIAKWHDESHLNRFAAFNHVSTLGPEYCYDGKVKLGVKTPLVLAVEK